MSPEDFLRQNGITLDSYATGRYYTTCPQCSRDRATAEHRKAKVLGVTIDDGSVRWGCNHCGWSGPNPGDGGGNGNGRGQPLIVYIYRDKDSAPLFRKVRNKPRDPPFYIQKWDGSGWAKGKEQRG
jgi:hypothetical protein